MRTKLRGPVKVRGKKQTEQGEFSEAWFYENPRSIDVYVSVKGRTHSCRIPRAPLLAWIERTKP